MIKSMTGYGRKELIANGKKIQAEIKSVNHRFSDYNIKVPRYYGFLEDKVRNYVSEKVSRGKIDIFINIDSYEEAGCDIILNKELLENYLNVLHEMCSEYNLKDDITVSSVAGYNDIFKTERREEDEETIWNEVKGVLDEAINDFLDMRSREGERIETDLRRRIDYMSSLAKTVEERSPETVKKYEERLYTKIKEVLDDREIDEARVLTEVAIFADKVAVNEETVRLASHFSEFINILDSDEPAGRKLDFLIQEINREINTIGSKAQDLEIAKTVMTLKAETEKLREQIQNIE